MKTWKWQVEVEKVELKQEDSIVRMRPIRKIGRITLETENHNQQEFEILLTLTTPQIVRYNRLYSSGEKSPLWELLHDKEDGFYRLIVYKQNPSSFYYDYSPLFAFYGYFLIRKEKDKLLAMNKFFQAGQLFDVNVSEWIPREYTRQPDKKNPRNIDFLWEIKNDKT
jgi:hypothetical protein